MRHDGICGHCGSAVPQHSVACTACGATWRAGDAGNTTCLVGFLITAVGMFAAVEMPGQTLYAAVTVALGGLFAWMGTMRNRPAWYR